MLTQLEIATKCCTRCFPRTMSRRFGSKAACLGEANVRRKPHACQRVLVHIGKARSGGRKANAIPHLPPLCPALRLRCEACRRTMKPHSLRSLSSMAAHDTILKSLQPSLRPCNKSRHPPSAQRRATKRNFPAFSRAGSPSAFHMLLRTARRSGRFLNCT